jgi:integrase
MGAMMGTRFLMPATPLQSSTSEDTLTAARSGEVRGATWGEIDAPSMIWTIPAGA